MSVYVSKLEIPTTFNLDSSVIFRFNTGEYLKYKVNYGWFLSEKYGGNERIFTVLGIENKYEFIENVIGYCPNGGIFPTVRTIEDLKKVVKALAEYNKPVVIEDKKEEKFTLSVKKHKQTKLNFKL